MISKYSFRKKRLGIIWAKSKGFIICQVYETYWPCSLIGGPYFSLASVKSCHNAEPITSSFHYLFNWLWLCIKFKLTFCKSMNPS